MTTREQIELERHISHTIYAREYKYRAYELFRENGEEEAAETYYKDCERKMREACALFSFALDICPISCTQNKENIVYDWLGIEPDELEKAAYHQAEADFKNGLLTAKYC